MKASQKANTPHAASGQTRTEKHRLADSMLRFDMNITLREDEDAIGSREEAPAFQDAVEY